MPLRGRGRQKDRVAETGMGIRAAVVMGAAVVTWISMETGTARGCHRRNGGWDGHRGGVAAAAASAFSLGLTRISLHPAPELELPQDYFFENGGLQFFGGSNLGEKQELFLPRAGISRAPTVEATGHASTELPSWCHGSVSP